MRKVTKVVKVRTGDICNTAIFVTVSGVLALYEFFNKGKEE